MDDLKLRDVLQVLRDGLGGVLEVIPVLVVVVCISLP